MAAGRALSDELADAAARWAFATYSLDKAVPAGSTLRIGGNREENPAVLLEDHPCDLTEIQVVEGSGASLAVVGVSRGAIDIGDNVCRRVVVVGFRGTVVNSSSNWATNLMAMKRPHCPGSTAHVHAGYLRHWRHLQAAGLTRAVVDKAFAADRDSVLVVTGHSLGGAVAQIAALELTELIDREVIVYAYGAPRFVCDATFDEAYKFSVRTSHRIEHLSDPIPRFHEYVPQQLLKLAACVPVQSAVRLFINGASQVPFLTAVCQRNLAPLADRVLGLIPASVVPMSSVHPSIRVFAVGVLVGITAHSIWVDFKSHGSYADKFLVFVEPPEPII